jgi:uncharacterized protein (TIGR00725 family)
MVRRASDSRAGAARGRRAQVAVSGAGTCSPVAGRTAEALGAALAELGVIVICGGLGGVMEAVARGVRRRGGVVIGVLPGYDRRAGNRYLSAAVPTGLGHGRNVLVAAAGDVLVALPGGPGTLSEIALALKLGRPVVGLGAWGGVSGVREARNVDAAMAAVRAVVSPKRGGRS